MTTDVTRSRRMVATRRPDGDAAPLVSDAAAPVMQLPTGRALAEVWRTDSLLTDLPADAGGQRFPGLNGARMWILEVPPDTEHHDHPLHGTPTIDLGFLLSGVLDLELGDGTVTRLHPGDGFMQDGTEHRWVNRGTDTAVLGVVVVGTGRH